MLYVHLGQSKDCLRYIKHFFNAKYKETWFDDEFTKAVIKDVDKTDVVKGAVMHSKWKGYFQAKELSSGVKTILIAHFEGNKYGTLWATHCGDNCFKWLFEISKHKDLFVDLSHIPNLRECEPFELYLSNTGKTVHSHLEFVKELCTTQWYKYVLTKNLDDIADDDFSMEGYGGNKFATQNNNIDKIYTLEEMEKLNNMILSGNIDWEES